jgi:hypothetical protein
VLKGREEFEKKEITLSISALTTLNNIMDHINAEAGKIVEVTFV